MNTINLEDIRRRREMLKIAAILRGRAVALTDSVGYDDYIGRFDKRDHQSIDTMLRRLEDEQDIGPASIDWFGFTDEELDAPAYPPEHRDEAREKMKLARREGKLAVSDHWIEARLQRTWREVVLEGDRLIKRSCIAHDMEAGAKPGTHAARMRNRQVEWRREEMKAVGPDFFEDE